MFLDIFVTDTIYGEVFYAIIDIFDNTLKISQQCKLNLELVLDVTRSM